MIRTEKFIIDEVKNKISGRRLLFLIEGILLVVLLVFAIRQKEECVWECYDLAGGTYWESGVFPVSKGVYRVEAERARDGFPEIDFALAVRSESTFRSLLQNDVRMKDTQEKMLYEFYVTDAIDALQLQLTGKQEEIRLAKVSIFKTKKGNYARVIKVFCLVVLMDFYGMRLERRQKKKGEQGRTFPYGWGRFACIVLSCVPYFVDYLYLQGKEIEFIGRMELLKNKIAGISQDVFPGEPGGLFPLTIADLFLFPGSILRICGFPMTTAYHAAVFLLQACSVGLSFLCIDSCIRNKNLALFGCFIFTMLPYRMVLLFQRGEFDVCVSLLFAFLCAAGIFLLLQKKEEKATGKDRIKKAGWLLGIGAIGTMGGISDLRELIHRIVFIFVGVVFIVILKKLENNRKKRKILWLTGLILFFFAVYQLNELVYQSTPYYLYDPSGYELLLAKGVLK